MSNNNTFIKYSLRLYIKSQGAESGPPLGTILSNIGVNAVNFCKEFNSFTNELPTYFTLKVLITVLYNKSFSFFIEEPSLGSIVRLLRKNKTGFFFKKGRSVAFTYFVLSLSDFVQLLLFKFNSLDLRKAAYILWGSLKSAGILILR